MTNLSDQQPRPLVDYRQSSDETCRANNVGVGDVLRGDEGRGPTTIRITYIGDGFVNAKVIADESGGRVGRESSWSLGPWRRWEVLA